MPDMNYSITFYSRFHEILIDIYEEENGLPPPYYSSDRKVHTWEFPNKLKEYENCRLWMDLLDKTGLVKHVKYHERELGEPPW